ncbi:MAG: histidine phosphatase family protein [Planctomycetes bacterium]|nr:histidine phosphatase family protein [Planctomycetota bacterium]
MTTEPNDHATSAPASLPEDVQAAGDALSRTELWLVRHGESEGNSSGVLQGQAEYPLSARGREQVVRLAARLVGQHFTALYSSDLGRAVATAKILGAAVGLPVVQDRRLREIDIGSWSGLTFDEIAVRHPEEWSGWMRRRDPAHRRGGGESYLDLEQRIAPAMTDLAQRHPGGRLLIVSHGGSMGAYLAHVLGLPLDQLWRLSHENTGVSRVQPFTNPHTDPTIRPGRVLCINDAGHLDAR